MMFSGPSGRAGIWRARTFTRRRSPMQKQARWPAVCGLTAAMVLAVLGTAWGETQKFKGLIVARDGPNMIVKHEGADIKTTVTLDDSTKVQAIKGKLGL